MSSLSSTTSVGEKRKSDDLDTAETSKTEKRLKTEEKSPAVNPPTTKGLLSIKLNSMKKDDKVNVTKTKTNSAVEPLVKIDRKLRAVFDADDSGEEFCEQMPLEAKMKMRNIGRDTPTSSGPNSFSKGKHGFIDIRKMHEKQFDD